MPSNGACGAADGELESTVSELERDSFRRVNAERSARGAARELVADAELARLARSHSESMRDEGFFSHVTPEGMDPAARLGAAGYWFFAVGENIVRVENVSDPGACAHSVLMESEGHRDNILSGDYARLGVGVALGGESVWITQIFAR